MNHNAFPTHEEDPLAGDVERTGGYDETQYVDVRDLEVNEDQHGNAVDGHGNLIDPDDEVYDEDNLHPSLEDMSRPTTNVFIIELEKALKEAAAKQGVSEKDAAKIYGADFVLKDADGNPTDTLRLSVSDYSGPMSRPGVQGFELAPINGEKDQWGRDKKFVRGHFSMYSTHPDKPEDSSYSMSYGGGSPEQLREYVSHSLQEDVLARAELVGLDIPTQE